LLDYALSPPAIGDCWKEQGPDEALAWKESWNDQPRLTNRA
jgi:hypothetical protein